MTTVRGSEDEYGEAVASMRGLVKLIDHVPDLLPRVVAERQTNLAVMGQYRVLDEDHPCLRCGKTSTSAIVIVHENGYRGWMDLCQPCLALLYTVSGRAERRGLWG